MDDYLVYLWTKVTIDIHTYDKEPDEEGNYVEPDCLLLHEPRCKVCLGLTLLQIFFPIVPAVVGW